MAGNAGAIRAGRAFVEIGGDASGLGRVLDQASNMLKSWGRGIASQLGPSIIAGGQLLAGFVESTTNDYRAMSRELAHANQITGLSIETLSGLGYAAQQLGGSLEDVTHGLPHFAHFLSLVQTGAPIATRAMQLMGLEGRDLGGNLEQNFLRVSDALNNLTGTNRLEAIRSVFGRHGVQSANVLAAGSGQLRGLMAEGQSQGLTLTRAEVESGETLNRTWNRMTQSIKMLGIQIGAGLVPQFEWLANAVMGGTRYANQFIRSIRSMLPMLDTAATGITIGGVAVIGLGVGLQALGFALGGLMPLVRGAVGGWNAFTGAVRSATEVVYAAASASVNGAAALLRLAGAAAGPAVNAMLALANTALAPVRAALSATISAVVTLGEMVLTVALLPLQLLGGALLLLVGAAYMAATAIGGAAISIVASIVGGIGSALVFLGGVALAPFSSLMALFGSLWAGTTAMIANASATGVLNAVLLSLGVSEATLASITGFLTTAYAILAPVVSAAAAAHAAGSSTAVIFAAALTGLGLTMAQATAITTILTTAYAIYTGATSLGAGMTTILTSALIALGISESLAASITGWLGAAWAGLTALFVTGTGAISLASIATGILTIAKMGLSAAVSIASGAYALFSAALAWSAVQAINLLGWLAGLGLGQLAVSAAAGVGSVAMQLLGFVIGLVAGETVIAEAVTGAWVVALGALIIAAGAVVIVLLAVGSVLALVAGLAAVAAGAIATPFIVAGLIIWAFWDSIKGAAVAAWGWIVGVTTRALRAIGDFVAWVWGGISNVTSSAWGAIVDTATSAAAAIGSRFAELGAELGRIFGLIFDSIGAGNLAEAMAVGWAAIRLGWVQLANFLRESWLSWRNFFLDTAETALLRLREMWHNGAFSLSNIWQLLAAAVSASWTALTSFIRAAWQRTIDFVTGSSAAEAIESEATAAATAASAARGELSGEFNAERENRYLTQRIAMRQRELELARESGGEAERVAREELGYAEAWASMTNNYTADRRARERVSLPSRDQLGANAPGGTSISGTFSGAAASGLVGASNATVAAVNNVHSVAGEIRDILRNWGFGLG